jgi:hypothetical protein
VPVDLVRLAYVLHAALWCGLMEASMVGRLAFDAAWPARAEAFSGRPFGAILDRRADLGRFLVALVAEADIA